VSGPRPMGHLRVQGRWTPLWPVLDGCVPNLLEVGRECQPPLNRSRQFRAEGVRLVQSASGTSQAGRAQGLVVSFLRSRHSPPEDNPPSQSMSWISYSVGRFSGVHRWPVLGVRRGSRAPGAIRHQSTPSIQATRLYRHRHRAATTTDVWRQVVRAVVIAEDQRVEVPGARCSRR